MTQIEQQIVKETKGLPKDALIALILRLEKRKLSPKIKAIFMKAENGETKIIIPTMVLAEIGYLSENKKLKQT